MWDYVAFFGYNFLFFLFALFVWYVFPRPTPYDYTTIPGLQKDPEQPEYGNLSEMVATKNLSLFLSQLHEDYGPLASFYWGKQYVVAAGSFHLWHDIVKWSRKITAHVEIIPTLPTKGEEAKFNLPAATLSADQILEKVRLMPRNRESDSDTNWRSAINIVSDLKSKDEDIVSAADTKRIQMESALLKYEYALNRNSFAKGIDLSDSESIDESDFNENSELRSILICQALKRCFTRSSVLSAKADEKSNSESKIIDFDWPIKSLFSSTILEIIRQAVPFEYIFYTFEGEIDLNGHPIPAGVPIILYMNDVLVKRTNLNDSKSFLIDRFQQKEINSNDSFKFFPNSTRETNQQKFVECLLTLPYVDFLSSAVAAYLLISDA